jgi:hypothetical protein
LEVHKQNAESSNSINIVTDLINTLPDNSSVNTVQHATIAGAVLYIRATPSAGNGPLNSRLTRDTFLCGLRQATVEQWGYAIHF